MIWLSWRQVRASIVVVAAVVVALAVLLAVYGVSLLHLYDTTVVGCAAHGDCAAARQNLGRQAHWTRFFSIMVAVVPALTGAFWGAPLVAREIETGTWRLALTQSVSRRRWFWSRFAVLGLTSMACAGAVSLTVTWWATPADRLSNAPYWTFDQRDIVPVAYAAFAFALGVAVGTVVRRSIPAMAATLAGFIGVRFVVSEWVRPHLLAPRVARIAFDPFGPVRGGLRRLGAEVTRSLVLTNDIYSRSGRLLGQNGNINVAGGGLGFRPGPGGVTRFVGVGTCPNTFPVPAHGGAGARVPATGAMEHAAQACVASFHLYQVVTFQPTGHYWPLQWIESGLFVVLAAGLALGTLWWVRRKLI